MSSKHILAPWIVSELERRRSAVTLIIKHVRIEESFVIVTDKFELGKENQLALSRFFSLSAEIGKKSQHSVSQIRTSVFF